MKKIIASVVISAAALSASACASWVSGDDSDVSYAPAAYYQVVNNVYECYYITSPAEAEALKAAGLCPPGALDVPMPQAWEATYWSYWSSPAYYNTYIPASYRSNYTHVTIVSLNRSTSFTRMSTSLSSRATYRGTNGSTVTGVRLSSRSYSSTGSQSNIGPRSSYTYVPRNGSSQSNLSSRSYSSGRK